MHWLWWPHTTTLWSGLTFCWSVTTARHFLCSHFTRNSPRVSPSVIPDHTCCIFIISTRCNLRLIIHISLLFPCQAHYVCWVLCMYVWVLCMYNVCVYVCVFMCGYSFTSNHFVSTLTLLQVCTYVDPGGLFHTVTVTFAAGIVS